MPGIDDYNHDGTLTIGSVLMNRPAWAILGDDTGEGGLLHLWVETEVRGDDRLLPGAAGIIPYQRRLAPARHDLRLLVTGDVNENGVANANSKTGLIANLNYIYANVIAPTGTGDGTRAATLTATGITSRTANIHVLGLKMRRANYDDTSAAYEGTLQISIPAGRFA